MKTRVFAAAMAALVLALTTGPSLSQELVRDANGSYWPADHAGVAARVRTHANAGNARIVPHPSGCPRRLFCGCGVSVKVFGKPIRALYLAANWLYKFPRTSPAAGTVAARRGHVFYIVSMINANTALAYDPNSGNGLTRIHERSLVGYTVVDPRGSRIALR